MGGSILGVCEDASTGSTVVELEDGDTLVLYTDGAIEARRDNVMFGLEGVKAAIEAAPDGASAMAQALEMPSSTTRAEPISDDVAALVLHVPR